MPPSDIPGRVPAERCEAEEQSIGANPTSVEGSSLGSQPVS